MLNIYIANLGKYNEGQLVGKWLELPCSDEEIFNTLKEIGINKEYEEYAIHDYECSVEGMIVPEYASISMLNDLANELEDMEAYKIKLIEALLESKMITQDDILENNYDLDDYRFVELDEDIYNKEKALGYALIEIGCLEISKEIEPYFDYEKYGRDAIFDGAFIASNGIALF